MQDVIKMMRSDWVWGYRQLPTMPRTLNTRSFICSSTAKTASNPTIPLHLTAFVVWFCSLVKNFYWSRGQLCSHFRFSIKGKAVLHVFCPLIQPQRMCCSVAVTELYVGSKHEAQFYLAKLQLKMNAKKYQKLSRGGILFLTCLTNCTCWFAAFGGFIKLSPVDIRPVCVCATSSLWGRVTLSVYCKALASASPVRLHRLAHALRAHPLTLPGSFGTCRRALL